MLDSSEDVRALALLVDQNSDTIINALQVFVRHMRESSAEARAAYEAGQNNGLISNNGFRMSAELFEQQADSVQRIINEIENIRAGHRFG